MAASSSVPPHPPPPTRPICGHCGNPRHKTDVCPWLTWEDRPPDEELYLMERPEWDYSDCESQHSKPRTIPFCSNCGENGHWFKTCSMPKSNIKLPDDITERMLNHTISDSELELHVPRPEEPSPREWRPPPPAKSPTPPPREPPRARDMHITQYWDPQIPAFRGRTSQN